MFDRDPSSANVARRHFMRIVAAGAARLSAIAAASALLANKRASAMDPGTIAITIMAIIMTLTVLDGNRPR